MDNIEITGDGSKTIYSERFGEHYHSTFGAANESKHVFIEAGYMASAVNPVSVLEIGFGTGLNAYLTLLQAEKINRTTFYETVELYAVDSKVVQSLSDNNDFLSLHSAPWEVDTIFTTYFEMLKRRVDLQQARFTRKFDVVYFDAFSPAVQPEMWSFDIFAKLYEAMNTNAILTTYCAKGEVRRTMQSAGFTVERLPGPTGKREMLRGRKTGTSLQ